MKKLFTTLFVVVLLGSELFAGFYINGTIHKVSIRSDGTLWVSMKRKSNGKVTGTYKFVGNQETIKAIQAAVLSAKLTSAPVQLFWHEKKWYRVELLP